MVFTGAVGQGGSGDGAEAAGRGYTFPAGLATRLFDADDGIDRVFVMSNTVAVRRPRGWSEDAVDAITSVVADFFRFYRE